MDKKPSQADLLFNLLRDEQPHDTREIMAKVYGNDHLGLARVGARVWDVKNKPEKYGDVEFKGWHDKENASIYWYQMTFRKPQVLNPQVYSQEYLERQEKKKQGVLI